MTRIHRTPLALTFCFVAVAALSSACSDDGDPTVDETSEGDGDGDLNGDGDGDGDLSGDGDGDGDGDPSGDGDGDGDPSGDGDGDGDPSGDGDGDGDPTGDGDGDLGEEIRVSNTEADCIDGYVAPALPFEASHLAATVLTPDAYPFEITRLRYVLGGPGAIEFCNGSLGHRVDLFVSDGGTPSAAPSETEPFVSVEVPGDPMAVDGRTVDLDLGAGVILESGQALVVAIEMRGDDELDTRLCVAMCEPDGPPLEGIDWWSNAAGEPYDWADLIADFGFPDNIAVAAYGVVTSP